MIIKEVRATTCRIPLTTPIVMGDLQFDSREYLLLEITTDEGLTGVGFGMTRDAPLGPIVARNVAPLLLGADPLLGEALWERLYNRNLTIGQRGLFMRCLSAADIALWDIKAKAAGLPLWKLLGGYRDLVPASMAGGYPRTGVSLEALAAEVAGYAAEGYQWIKIAAGPLAADTERLRVARDAIAGRSLLAYDAHWAWRTIASVLPTVRSWPEFGLAFIEDPFPSDLTLLPAQLRERTGISMALGEDTVGRYAFRDLVANARPDYLRLDATTAGGVTDAIKICALAAAEGIPVLPHIFPELHVHLAAALPIVMAVEVTDPAQEIDLLWRLFRDPLAPSHGSVAAPSRPGLGVALDRAAVARYAVGEEVLRAGA
jgi:L-alanine-DL-glutamate epimerase-like enolase superfamily enzyme